MALGGGVYQVCGTRGRWSVLLDLRADTEESILTFLLESSCLAINLRFFLYYKYVDTVRHVIPNNSLAAPASIYLLK